jgi:hypothetical protein
MERRSPVRDGRGMEANETNLVSASDDLRGAAAALAEAVESGTRDDVRHVLPQLETTLRDLTTACHGLGRVAVPRHADLSAAYLDRAAPQLPGLNEQKFRALADLDDLAASMAASARRCRHARAAYASLRELG